MPKTCECEVCIRGRRLKSVVGKLYEDDAKWLMDLGGYLAAAEMDAEYYTAIIAGDWPSSVEILGRALERAREKQKENTDA